MPGKTYSPEQLDSWRAFLWHARNRSACHHARRDRCECRCGGDYHKAGGIGLLEIPPDVLEELKAEANAATRGKAPSPRLPRPRRIKRHAAQLTMLLA